MASTRYQIMTEFSLIDNASRAMNKLGLSGRVLERTVGVGLVKAQSAWATMGRAAVRAVGAIGGAAKQLAVGGITESMRKYTEFEDTLTRAGTKFVDLDVTSSDYEEHLAALGAAAQEVGAITKYTASDAAGALDKMAMAGITSEQAMGMLMGTTNLATAAGIDLTSAVDMATDALGAFNMMKDEAGNPLDAAGIERSMNRVSDVVAKATNMANLDMGMWFETVKMGAPQFAALGGEIEEFSAMAGILANSGIKGSMAGTGINAMMSRLSAPGEKNGAGKALKELGIEVFDAEGRMRSFTDILGQFERGLAGVSDEESSRMLKDIFGMENVKSFRVLLAAGTGQLMEYTDALKNAGGAANLMARAQEKSLKGQLAALSSAIEAKQLQLGEAISKSGGFGILERIISMVQGLNIDSLVGALSAGVAKISDIAAGTIDYLRDVKGLGGSLNFSGLTEFFNSIDTASVVQAIGDAIANVAHLVGLLWDARGAILPLLEIWAGWRIAMMALVGPMKAAGVVVGFLNTAIGIGKGLMIAHAAATTGTTVAISAQNAATNGAVIGMKLYAVATKAAGAVSTAFSTGLGFVKGGLGLIWGGLVKATAAAWGFIAPILANPITWIVLGIVAAIALLSFGIYELVKHWDAVSAAVGRAVDWLVMVRDKVDGFFERIHNMEGVGGAILQFLVKPFELLWGLARGVIDVFQAFKNGGFLNGIKMLGLSILQFIFTPIQAILDLISLIPGINIGDRTRAWFGEMKAGLLNPKEETGADAVTDVMDGSALDPAIEPVNQRTVSESYSESTSRLDISLADGLSGTFEGAPAPGVTLDTGKRPGAGRQRAR